MSRKGAKHCSSLVALSLSFSSSSSSLVALSWGWDILQLTTTFINILVYDILYNIIVIIIFNESSLRFSNNKRLQFCCAVHRCEGERTRENQSPGFYSKRQPSMQWRREWYTASTASMSALLMMTINLSEDLAKYKFRPKHLRISGWARITI